MPVQKFRSFDAADPCCIVCNFYRIAVTLIHHDLTDSLSEYPGQEGKHVMGLFIQRLRPVSQDRHPAGEQILKDDILKIRIILHLIYDQMLDMLMGFRSLQPVLKIEHGKHILILDQALLI